MPLIFLVRLPKKRPVFVCLLEVFCSKANIDWMTLRSISVPNFVCHDLKLQSSQSSHIYAPFCLLHDRTLRLLVIYLTLRGVIPVVNTSISTGIWTPVPNITPAKPCIDPPCMWGLHPSIKTTAYAQRIFLSVETKIFTNVVPTHQSVRSIPLKIIWTMM